MGRPPLYPTDPKPCVVCGETFSRKAGERPHKFHHRATCSPPCWHRLQGLRKQRYPDPKPCVICGTEMVYDPAREKSSIFLRRQTCSPSCFAALKSRIRTGKPATNPRPRQHLEPRTCVICGSSFGPTGNERPHIFKRRPTCGGKCADVYGGRVRRHLPGYRTRNGFYPYSWTPQYRDQIRTRDGHACQECGVLASGRLHHVHHINYDKGDLAPSNLITLCASCHGQTNYRRDYWRARFTAHLIAKGLA